MREHGQSLVELAISFVVLMFFLSGAVEFGIIFFQYVQLRDAAQEGALYGSMSPGNSALIEERVRGSSDTPINLSTSDVDVLVSYPNGSLCEGNAVQVNVVYHHKIFMPFMPKLLGRNEIILDGQVTDTILNQVCGI